MARSKDEITKSMFFNSGDEGLVNMGTEQIEQVLCAALEAHLYAKNDLQA